MRLYIRTVILLMLVSWAGVCANAVPIPPLNVPVLAAASDLVVTGNLESMRDAGETSIKFSGRLVPAQLLQCEIQIGSVLKGATESQKLSFRYVLPSEPIGYAGLAVGYQMIFLRRANSEYELVSPYHPSLPALPEADGVAGDELARIANRLGAVLQSPSPSLDKKQMALYALSTIRNPESTALLHRTLGQTDPVLRLNAAGFLLLRDDLDGMQPAEQALSHPEGLPGNVLHNLNYAIHEGIKNESAIPNLTRLAKVQELETRRAVASALKHTSSKLALPPLAYLLNDSDIQVRHDAVVGLAEIAGEPEWGPNLDLFQSQEQTYMKHWRDWVSANGYLK